MKNIKRSMYSKSICLMLSFLMIFSLTGDAFGENTGRVLDHISPRSVFSPLAGIEIKDIAMLEYVLTSASLSGKLNMITELGNRTSTDLGVDLESEGISMEFLFSQASYYENRNIRVVPAVLTRNGEEIRYWCAVLASEDRSSGYELVFFTEKEVRTHNLLSRIEMADMLERAEAIDISRYLESERQQDELIRKAIKEGKYKVVENNYAPIYSVYAFLDAVSRGISRDLGRTVSAGQLMVILDENFKTAHPGSRGIYLPYDKGGISPAIIVHEAFAEAGFTHEECKVFKDMFEKYITYFSDGNIDTSGQLPEEMLAGMNDNEKRLLARVAGSSGFVDLTEYMRERDYSASDLGGAEGYGDAGKRLYASLSMQASRKGVATPDVAEVENFLEKLPRLLPSLQPLRSSHVQYAVFMLRTVGMHEEADILEEYSGRGAIKTVAPLQSGLFDKIDALHITQGASEKVPAAPYMFIASHFVEPSNEGFMRSVIHCASMALQSSPEREKDLAGKMEAVTSGHMRTDRAAVVTDIELRKYIESLGSPEDLPVFPSGDMEQLSELLRATGRFKETQILDRLIAEKKIRTVKKDNVFQRLYSASCKDKNGDDWVFMAEDLAFPDSALAMSAAARALRTILNETDTPDTVDFDPIDSIDARSLASVMKILRKEREVGMIESLHAEGRIIQVHRKGVNFKESKGIYYEDSRGRKWMLLPKYQESARKNASSYSGFMQSAVKVLADALESSEEERNRMERIVYPDMRNVIVLDRAEKEALGYLIAALEDFRAACIEAIDAGDMRRVSALSREIGGLLREKMMSENSGNVISWVLHTITLGGALVGSPEVHQLDGEDRHSLEGFDMINGVTFPLVGYAELIAQDISDEESRAKIIGAFTDRENNITQRFDNIMELLKAIRRIDKAIVVVNPAGHRGRVPLVDVVGTLTKNAVLREKEYRELLNTVPVGIHVITPEGIIKDINDFECAMLGYTREEMTGRSIMDFVVPEQREEVSARITTRAKGLPMPAKTGPRLYLKKDGSRIAVDTTDTLVKNERGETVEIRTALREVKSAHSPGEDLVYDKVLNSMPEGFAYFDVIEPDGVSPGKLEARYANRVLRDITDLGASSMDEKGLPEVSAWLEQEGLTGWLLEAASRGHSGKIEKYSGTLDRWFSMSAYSPGEGQLAVTFEDITTRKRAELELAAFIERTAGNAGNIMSAEQDFLRELDRSFLGMVLFDSEGSVVRENLSARDIFGVSSHQDIQGMNMFRDPNISEEVISRLKQGKTARLSTYGFDVINAKGIYNSGKKGTMDVECVITPLGSSESGPIGYIMRIQDNARKEQAKEDAARPERVDMASFIKKGKIDLLTPRQMAMEIQMVSVDKVALVFGDLEAGKKELAKTGFKGEIRHARDRDHLIAMKESGELAEVDFIVNTTNEEIRDILRDIETTVIDKDVLTERNRLQRTIIEICA